MKVVKYCCVVYVPDSENALSHILTGLVQTTKDDINEIRESVKVYLTNNKVNKKFRITELQVEFLPEI